MDRGERPNTTKRRKPRIRPGLFLVAAAGLLGLFAGPALASSGAASPSAPPPPQVPVPPPGTGALTGFATEIGQSDNGMPPGIVNAPCTPAVAHPYPVVLVHGTFANENLTWQTLAPMLSDAGYCVFGLNYGANSMTTTYGDHSYGLDYIENSAGELKGFISDKVIPDTFEQSGNAAGYPAGSHPLKVDVVGHSQGGMMPRYLIDSTSDQRFPGLGDAAQVHTLVGLAPSNHGSAAEGLVPIFAALFGASVYSFPTSLGCPACSEQEAGSAFLKALNGNPDSSGVNYYVIETSGDEVVTPYQSAFLPATENVENVMLQAQCPTDLTDHIGIIYDPVALQDVMAALSNNGSAASRLPQPTCPSTVLPLLSG